MTSVSRYSFGRALAILSVLTAVRLFLLFKEYYPLYGDEAQYWLWSKTLDWGYYSKPPLLAWIIALTVDFWGDSPFGVRFASPLLHCLTGLMIYRIGKKLYGAQVGFYSALTYGFLPAVGFSTQIMSTDVPLLFCWATALYAYLKVQDDAARPYGWLALGGALGLGLLAKYAMIFFFLGMGFHVLLWRRDLLRSPGLWGALAIALGIFAPNLWWNAHNHFSTFNHTVANANLGGSLFHPAKLAAFVGSQFAVFGPLLFPALLVLFVTALILPMFQKRFPEARAGLLAVFALPPLLTMSCFAFLSRANANWAATAYVSACVLVAAQTLFRAPWRWLVPVSLGLHGALMGIGYAYHDLAKLVGIELTRTTDPALKAVMGSPALGKAVAQTLQQMPKAVLMTDDRMLFALLAFYVRPPAVQVQWNPDGIVQNHFELTTRIEDYREDEILYVTHQEAPDALAHFRDARRIGKITLPLAKDYAKIFHLYRLQGLQR